ncbi:MAG: hypothetical protein CMO01_10330 [Thalassobius sp.]|nr:hypothetical protein [Thalassovita sp.]
MEKYLKIFSIISVLFLASCSMMDCEEGTGDIVSKEMEIGEFTDLKVSGEFEIILNQSDKYECKVSTYENLMDLIEVRNAGRAIEIKTKSCVSTKKRIKVYVTAPQIALIDISGACSIKNDELFEFKDLEIDGSGACNLDLNLDANSISMDLSGASEVFLKGTAAELTCEVTGAGKIKAFDLKTLDADIKISGAGDCDVNVKNNLYARVSGAGNVNYRGNPEKVDSKISGAGNISKSDNM